MLPFIRSDSSFYIYCPAGLATGGPELLHQLGSALKQIGQDVKMVYVGADSHLTDPVHPNYVEYDLSFVKVAPDDDRSVVILPETFTYVLSRFSYAKCVVWWLSVDNYFRWLPGLKGRLNRFLGDRVGIDTQFFFDARLKRAEFHLGQSRYSLAFLNKHGIFNCEMLSDYLHQEFSQIHVDLAAKQDVVVYNPKKGGLIVERLIREAPDLCFIPIRDMTRQQVVALLKQSKVYIDFGNHPGCDRIPREAAVLQNCVLTGRRGSAKFHEDVPIPEEFKFSDRRPNTVAIVEKIRDCFLDYPKINSKFDFYRDAIKAQRSSFLADVYHLFGRSGEMR